MFAGTKPMYVLWREYEYTDRVCPMWTNAIDGPSCHEQSARRYWLPGLSAIARHADDESIGVGVRIVAISSCWI
jgi:hypothetical protein